MSSLSFRRWLRAKPIALVLASAMVATACSSSSTGSETPGSDVAATPTTQATTTTVMVEPEVSNDESATNGPTFPRTITHALGIAEIKSQPLRVVALDSSMVDAALTLGLEVIGYTTYSDPDGPLPPHFGDSLDLYASDALWVGDLLAPSLELIVTLKPDLILTTVARHEGIYDQLAAIAPTVVADSSGGGWKEGLILAAEASGREDLAGSALATYHQRAKSIGDEINESHDNPTLSIVRFLNVIRLYQPVSFSGVVFDDAGLARPESQQDYENFIAIISEEELTLADADYLFYTVWDDPAVAEEVANIHGRPLWSTLEAVQADRAFPVSDATWMSGVGMFGANAILDDLALTFDVDG